MSNNGTIEAVLPSILGNVTVNKKKAPTATFRVNAEMARKIRIISAARKQSVPDYLADLIGPLVERDYIKFAKSVAKETAGPKPDVD